MRRPARLERAGALTPRDRIWSAIRSFGHAMSFSVAELMVISEEPYGTVILYLEAMRIGGFLRRSDEVRPMRPPRAELNVYWLERDVGVEAPRLTREGKPETEHLGQQQMWTFMRKMKVLFDWRELVQGCPHPVSLHAAKLYLRLLARAGYLIVGTAARGTIPASYRFVRARNTGPRAPIISGHSKVIDCNTGAVVYDQKVQLQGGEHDR
jgi:hypothetical protein